MKKKLMKGLTLGLITAFVATAAVPAAFADEPDKTASGHKIIPFHKELALKDVDNATVVPKAPKVTFSYTVTPGTAGTEGYSGANKQIYAGVGTPTIESLTFGPTDPVKQKNDWNSQQVNVVSKATTVNFESVKFTHPGIFRYTVTENAWTNAQGGTYTYTAEDIPTLAHKNNQYTLDVYVNSVDGKLVITGYKEVIKYKDGGVDKEKKKSGDGGFTVEKEPVYGEDGTNNPVDNDGDTSYSTYYTHDVKVKKEVTDPIAGEKFNLTFNLPNEQGAQYKLTKNNGSTTNIDITQEATSRAKTIDFAKDDEYTISGLPVSSTITVEEKADATFRTKYNAPTATKGAEALTMTDDGSTKYTSGTIGTNSEDNKPTAVVIKNSTKKVDDGGNTGLFLTYLPYIAMVGLAGAFFFLFIKRRREEEEEA